MQIDYTAPAPPRQEKRNFVNTESKREELKQIVLSADEQELDRIIKILVAMQEAENDQRGSYQPGFLAGVCRQHSRPQTSKVQ